MKFLCCLAALFLLISCKKASTKGEGDKVLLGAPLVQPTDEPPTVRFAMKNVNASPRSSTVHRYECAYTARGKTAKFGLELRYGPPDGRDLPIAAAEGKFIAEPGSDATTLLEDLKAALMAKKVPTGVSRIKELPFDAAVLGEHQSENPGGGFSNKPAGDWAMLKLFLPKDGDDKGELFLSINPVLGKGEFSIKDEDYGDYLLQEFAKVL